MKKSQWRIALGIVFLAGLFAACDEPRSIQTDAQTVALGGARRADVELRMGAGELRLAGASQDALLEAAFRYNRARLRPEIDYRVSGETGILKVGYERRRGLTLGRIRNEWDLKLSQAIPIDLKVKLGAGRSDLDLRGLELTRVDIDMGVGEMNLDLQGPHAKSFDVKIDGGIGSGTIYLPAEVGVRAKVDGGIGSVSARGLLKHGKVYTNEAYGKSGVTIDIDIDAGIGSLDLRVESAGRVRI